MIARVGWSGMTLKITATAAVVTTPTKTTAVPERTPLVGSFGEESPVNCQTRRLTLPGDVCTRASRMSKRPGEAVCMLTLGTVTEAKGTPWTGTVWRRLTTLPAELIFIKHIAPLCPSAISPDWDSHTLPAPPAAPFVGHLCPSSLPHLSLVVNRCFLGPSYDTY